MLDQIREQEEREAKEKAEREAAEKERRKRELEEEEAERLHKIAEQAALALSVLPEEPDQDDPLACHLVLRLPAAGERVSRRFSKDDKVAVLYHFIDSLAHDRVIFENGGVFGYTII